MKKLSQKSLRKPLKYNLPSMVLKKKVDFLKWGSYYRIFFRGLIVRSILRVLLSDEFLGLIIRLILGSYSRVILYIAELLENYSKVKMALEEP